MKLVKSNKLGCLEKIGKKGVLYQIKKHKNIYEYYLWDEDKKSYILHKEKEAIDIVEKYYT
tara:strand:- start:295 stop:477 length:183 start_codon:yes stop_codon:yes gene_type:complete